MVRAYWWDVVGIVGCVLYVALNFLNISNRETFNFLRFLCVIFFIIPLVCQFLRVR